jgi:hypothetical protein
MYERRIAVVYNSIHNPFSRRALAARERNRAARARLGVSHINRDWIRWGITWSIEALLTIPLLFFVRASYRARRQRNRLRRGVCPRCTYDLRATPDRCPECGLVLASLDPRPDRRCAARIAFVACTIIFIGSVALWARSYWTTDCLLRVGDTRCDSLYCSRGVFVFTAQTAGNLAGWSYESGDPASFPRSTAESGDARLCGLLGLEYSWISGVTIVPAWVIALLAGVSMGLLAGAMRRGAATKSHDMESG